MHYHPLTEEDQKEMLAEIGVSTFEDLLKGIPASLRNFSWNLPETLSELEVQGLIKEMGSRNETVASALSFLGGGSYQHFIPTAAMEIAGRNEFYTAYTPYQAEASQGVLQSIYEYQSLITELTGLDISNASHYDGATSTAEAALLALKHTDRNRVLVSSALHPHYREVLETYLEGTPYHYEEFGCLADGRFDSKDFSAKLSDDLAGVIFQTPNFFGVVEDLEGIGAKLHEQGTLLIIAANPLSLPVFRAPVEWDADVAVGEGQPLGIPPQFGGPYLGYFSVTRSLMRRVPGRLCGLTQDADGRRAFALTLQAREQHIRRERAASNICTNQALCALAACAYMTLMGKKGIRELAEINIDRAWYLREKINKINGYSCDTQLPVFNEFVVQTDRNFRSVQKKLVAKNIFPGIALEDFYPERKNQFLVCATETKTPEQLDRFVKELSKC